MCFVAHFVRHLDPSIKCMIFPRDNKAKIDTILGMGLVFPGLDKTVIIKLLMTIVQTIIPAFMLSN